MCAQRILRSDAQADQSPRCLPEHSARSRLPKGHIGKTLTGDWVDGLADLSLHEVLMPDFHD